MLASIITKLTKKVLVMYFPPKIFQDRYRIAILDIFITDGNTAYSVFHMLYYGDNRCHGKICYVLFGWMTFLKGTYYCSFQCVFQDSSQSVKN